MGVGSVKLACTELHNLDHRGLLGSLRRRSMAAEKEVTACEFFMKTFVWMGRNPVEWYLLLSALGVAKDRKTHICFIFLKS